jgi:arginyl-tRNA synthetase
MNILSELKDRFRPVLGQFVDDPDELLTMIRPAQNPQFGDYQANFPMPLGKRLGQPPRDVAAEIVAQFDAGAVCQPPEIAGPGFINLRLQDAWLTEQLERARHDERLGIPTARQPKTFVIDFSSPNVAKPLHVGHIRSTVIGDALCRTLRFLGHHVISDNHLGDWGTQFGMIIYGYRHFVDEAAYVAQPINELGRLYKLVRRLMDYHDSQAQLPELEQNLDQRRSALAKREQQPASEDAKAEKKSQKQIKKERGDLKTAEDRRAQLKQQIANAEADPELVDLLPQHASISQEVLAETVKLHAGDEENRALWNEFLPKCLDDIHTIYDRLDVKFDQELGESFYHDRLAEVVQSLRAANMAVDSEGAVVVPVEGFAAPFMIQKKDGAFLYATSDLATIQFRQQKWNPDAVLYVVDFRQQEHFDKLFSTAAKWGYDQVELAHVKFGTVLGEDGKPYKTRSGDTVGLTGLLDEAERKALEVVAANDAEQQQLTADERQQIAKTVGIAALKYADLSQNRESDYVFSYDKMLALNGNTATYMQYSYARCHGIFSRGGVTAEEIRASDAKITIGTEAERALALQLLRFEEALQETLVDYRPNMLTDYLFKLAKTFSTFFEQCPVLKAESTEVRNSRLLLCDLTARTLKTGLRLLGISVVEKM